MKSAVDNISGVSIRDIDTSSGVEVRCSTISSSFGVGRFFFRLGLFNLPSASRGVFFGVLGDGKQEFKTRHISVHR